MVKALFNLMTRINSQVHCYYFHPITMLEILFLVDASKIPANLRVGFAMSRGGLDIKLHEK